MPSDAEIARFNARNTPGPRDPVEEFVAEPLPPSVLKAFPDLAEWQKRENNRRQEFIKRLNNVNQAV